MARAKTPEFHKTFSITCQGRACNKEQARLYHEMDITYKLKWIKGSPSKPELIYDDTDINGEHLVRSVITFTDRRYSLNEEFLDAD